MFAHNRNGLFTLWKVNRIEKCETNKYTLTKLNMHVHKRKRLKENKLLRIISIHPCTSQTDTFTLKQNFLTYVNML